MNNLANLIRPESLDDIIGQEKIINLFKKLSEIEENNSFIFYGKSGVGKTTLALVLAKKKNKSFSLFNATNENKENLLDKLKNNKILIIDEIHRLNKDKQEILLPYLENEKIIIYATTTENPYFKIVPALRSRLKLLKFDKINNKDILNYIKKIINKEIININISDDLLMKLISFSNGDIRNIINNLDFVNLLCKNKEVSLNDLKNILPSLSLFVFKDGDKHYDLLSAFHKSLRGSDADAALYYGLQIAKNGDIDGLFRRLIMVTYEDVSLASSNISLKVDCAIRAIERIGFPEAYTILSSILVEVAITPKSNSTYLAGEQVLELIHQGNIYEIPNYLKDANYSSAKKLDYGIGYKYPHNYDNDWVNQKYLPKKIQNKNFFEYKNNSNEMKYKEYWQKVKYKSKI